MFSYPLTWTTFLNLAALIEMPYFSSTSGSGASRGPETKTSLPLFSSKTTERVSGTVTSRSPSSRARLVLTARASFQSSKEHPAITRQKPTREGNQEDCSSRHWWNVVVIILTSYLLIRYQGWPVVFWEASIKKSWHIRILSSVHWVCNLSDIMSLHYPPLIMVIMCVGHVWCIIIFRTIYRLHHFPAAVVLDILILVYDGKNWTNDHFAKYFTLLVIICNNDEHTVYITGQLLKL